MIGLYLMDPRVVRNQQDASTLEFFGADRLAGVRRLRAEAGLWRIDGDRRVGPGYSRSINGWLGKLI